MNLFPMTQTAALVGQLIDTKTSTVPMIEMTSFKPECSLTINSTRLERCSPEEEGMSSSFLEELLLKLKKDKTLNMHSVTVARHGRIVCEASFGAQRLDVWKHAFSASKSVTSIAVGMLIDDKLLSLDEKIINIFRDEVGPMAKLKLKELCVEDLLTMRSTVMFNEADSMTDGDWIKAFLAAPTSGKIGESFRYNSLNTYMLSAIVTKKTGKTLSQFLEDRLFSPLGIKDYYWEKCPKGIDKGGWGLYIRPEDFVKIGTLMLNKGIYNGQQIVSEEYVNMATVNHVDVKNESEIFDYGYQIWVHKNCGSYLFNGMLGQNVHCFKKSNIVVVANAGNSEMFQQSSYFKYLEESFNREFPDEIDRDKRALSQLSETIVSLSQPNELQTKGFLNRLSQVFSKKEEDLGFYIGNTFSVKAEEGKTVGILPLVLQSVENCYTKGIVSIGFSKDSEDSVCLVYKENEAEVVIPLGFDKATIFNLKYRNENFLVASSAKVCYNEDGDEYLYIRLDFMETPSTRIIKIVPIDEENICLEQTERPGADFMQELTDMFMAQIADKPILGTVYERFGAEFIEYKIEKIFNNKLNMHKKV